MAPWTWEWHFHPDVLLLIVALEGGYLAALRWLGPRHVGAGEVSATRGQVVAFTLGVTAILIAAYWPIHDLAEGYLYSVHMLQHLLLTLVAPPLLLLGIPAWLARLFIRPGGLFRVVSRMSRPIPALLLFNLVVALTHWSAVVDLAASSEVAHFLIHGALFGTAVLMWMPVLSPVIELPRLPYPGQMLYLFAQSLLPTVPASFLTFGSRPLYEVYAEAPRTFGISAITDQRIAGLLMKIVGGLILWGVIAVAFFKWHAQESADGSDALQWRDVERELSSTRLAR